MLARFSRWLNRGCEAFCLLALGAITLVILAQIFWRSVIGASLTWSEELARFLLVWLALVGAAVAMKQGAHVAVEGCLRLLPPGWQRPLRLVSTLSVAAFLATATFKGMELAFFSLEQRSPAMGIPMGVVYLAVPVSSAVMLFHLAAAVPGGNGASRQRRAP